MCYPSVSICIPVFLQSEFIPTYECTLVFLYSCIPVSLCQYPSIINSILLYNGVYLYQIQIKSNQIHSNHPFNQILVSMYPCIPVSLHFCIPVSLYPCIPVSLYPYITVSLYPYNMSVGIRKISLAQ